MEEKKRNRSQETKPVKSSEKVQANPKERKADKFWRNQKLFSIESLALIISAIAIIVSLIANQLAKESNKFSIQANELANEANDIYKEELTLTHRPYLWVENFGYSNDDNLSVNEIETVIFIVINSPVKIISSEMIYEVINGKEKIEIVRFNPQNGGVLYPSEKIQYTSFIGAKEKAELLNYIKNGFEAYRTCYVEYQMLSSEKKFSYKAKWRFNKNNYNWELSEVPEAN